MTRGGLYFLSLLQQPPQPPSPTPSYPEEPNGPTGPLKPTQETLESQQHSGMVTSGMPQPPLSQRAEAFTLNCVYLPVRGADFPETERRSFLCCSCIKGTSLVHLSITVSQLEIPSGCDPSVSTAKADPPCQYSPVHPLQ